MLTFKDYQQIKKESEETHSDWKTLLKEVVKDEENYKKRKRKKR